MGSVFSVSLRDLIVAFLVAIPAAFLVHPIALLLRRIFSRIVDGISYSVEYLRKIQIVRLERRLKYLHKVTSDPNRLLMRGLSKLGTGILYGFVSVICYELSLFNTTGIILAYLMNSLNVKVPDILTFPIDDFLLSNLGYSPVGLFGPSSSLAAAVGGGIFLGIATSQFRSVRNLIDEVAKEITKLEGRIAKLKVVPQPEEH